MHGSTIWSGKIPLISFSACTEHAQLLLSQEVAIKRGHIASSFQILQSTITNVLQFDLDNVRRWLAYRLLKAGGNAKLEKPARF